MNMLPDLCSSISNVICEDKTTVSYGFHSFDDTCVYDAINGDGDRCCGNASGTSILFFERCTSSVIYEN